jgi:H+/Cl- antiporter ClcA
MTQDLLIGIVALGIAAGLFAIALPNKYGESPQFLQFYAAPAVYPAVVLVFLALGVTELIVWAATMKGW